MIKRFSATNKDINKALTLSIIRDNGVVTKGFIKKSKEYEFKTDLKVLGSSNMKITDVKCYFYDKENDKVSLKSGLGVVKHSLPTKLLNANQIRITAEITYKVSAFSHKKLCVSCNATL